MSRLVLPLVDTQIKRLKPANKEYIKSDGNGLYLRVLPSGVKSFYFSYRFKNKLKRYALGPYPELTLANAREIAQEYRSLIACGIDPKEYQKLQEQNKETQIITLQQLAEQWRDKRLLMGKLKTQTILEAFRRVELHVLPLIGNEPITELNIKTIMPTLEPLRHSNTLYKINIALSQMFQYAEDNELIVKNPFRRIHEEFHYLGHKNQPSINPEQLPYFFKVLNNANIQTPTALLIEWQLLTILRSSEAVSVEWGDVDFEKRVLHIPAERMKGGKRDHDVPLSRQALQILEKMRQYNGNRKYIFSSYAAPYNKPMSNQAANVAIKRIGFKGMLVAHGLRSIASTYLHDLDRFSVEAIELCLSHENRTKVRAAYDKSKKWKSRIEIMQTWGDYVEKCKIEAIKA